MKLYFLLLSLSSICALTISDDDGEDDTEEIVLDEVVDDHVKQHLLVDRNYNSSFTISVPMLTVLVPGTSRVNGIVRFSVSHLTLWTLVSAAFVGLVYPLFIGPHGKLHKRSFQSRDIGPTFIDHLETVVNFSQLHEDITSIVPARVAEQCLLKTICEAHKQVEQFGIAGLVLRSVYPLFELNVFGNEVMAEYRKAAKFGISSEYSCDRTYRSCRLSPLDVYHEALQIFSGSSSNSADKWQVK